MHESDAAESPPAGKHRSKASTLRNEENDFSVDPISEPKCIDSLCNSINTRLKLLENEIFAQHKVWDTIQKEIVEVKCLIEDCSSTCESSSLSAPDNESDSEWDAHEECTHSLWNRLQRAEQKLQEKKSAMQLLARQISRIKQTNKNGKKKTAKPNSGVGLILQVTNGLQYLKCEECKFCNEHADFRKGLVSSIIDLIHFNEKNNNAVCEENKTLKNCLHKICTKMKSCLSQSQVFSKSHQYHHHLLDTDGGKFNTDSIYKTFDDFCQHFQKLQEEILRLKRIYLSSEDGQGEDLCNHSHSSNCKCFLLERVRHVSDDYEDDDTKLYKTNKKVGCSYEKKLKTLPHDDTEDFYMDRRHVLEMNSYSTETQLQSLRSKIFDAVHLVRDVEIEYNDDENLIGMVTSLSEECSALRQEVSYLRNVRQEKKKAWNKLQCFVMDAERKLRGNGRTISNLREVIRELGDMIASSDSSSLDETILYMYSNQLEWLEKLMTGYESPTKSIDTSDTTECDINQSVQSRECNNIMLNNIGIQTMDLSSEQIILSDSKCMETGTREIAVQADDSVNIWSSENADFEPLFQEINREMYILPEVQEDCDVNSITNNCEVSQIKSSLCSIPSPIEADFTSHGSFFKEENVLTKKYSNSNAISEVDHRMLPTSAVAHRSILPKLDFERLLQEPLRFDAPVVEVSESASDFGFREARLCAVQTLKNPYDFPVNNYGDKNVCFYIFPEKNSNITSLFSDVLYNVFKDSLKYTQFCSQDYNWSCYLLNSKHSTESKAGSLKYLPFYAHSEYGDQKGLFPEDSCISVAQVPNDIPNPDVQVILKAALIDRYLLSSMSDAVEFMPNITPRTFPSICTEEGVDTFASISDHASSVKQIVHNDIAKIPPSITSGEEIAQPNLTRSNTFICESLKPINYEEQFSPSSSEEFKRNIFDSSEESFLFTSVLSQMTAKKKGTSERNYTLYEINDSSKKESRQIFGDFLEPNITFQENPNKRFILCETGANEEMFDATPIEQQQSSNVIVFSKAILDLHKNVTSESQSQGSIFPLLPSYLPFGNIDRPSLTHRCEIYDISTFENMPKKDENTIFVPKQFLKMKTLSPLCQNTSEFNPQIVGERIIECAYEEPATSHIFSETTSIQIVPSQINIETSVEKKSESTQTTEISQIVDENESTQTTEISQIVDENESTQTTEISHIVDENESTQTTEINPIVDENEHDHEENDSKKWKKVAQNLKQNCDLKEKEEERMECDALGENCEAADPLSLDEAQSLRQDHKNRETSLQDEISALKENLSQQNVVLQRLKEQSEETNSLLVLKERKAAEFQGEINKLNEDLKATKSVKDLENKFCQTKSPAVIENYEMLQGEIVSLRQENQQFCQKIAKQTDAIQNIKSQLSATILHLKNLKDAAAKQLKKQKTQHLKTIKMKQQLQETKTALAKKLEELEIKDEQLSDKEFNLQEIKARLDSTVEDLNEKSKEISKYRTENSKTSDFGCQTEGLTIKQHRNEKGPNATLEKHSEILLELQAKLQHMEAAFSNKLGTEKHPENHIPKKPTSEGKMTDQSKDGNIWKLLTLSEQSYLNLVSKITDSLQISDLKGATALMNSSGLSCEDFTDARRQDHRKIIQSLEKLKKNYFYMQETMNREQKSQTAENIRVDERKPISMCHSEETHFQYLCDVLQKAQENVAREFSQKKPTSQQRTVVTAGSGKTGRYVVSRERKVPLELKNGKILALLDNKVTHRDLLPNKQDYNRMESRSGNGSTKSKTPS